MMLRYAGLALAFVLISTSSAFALNCSAYTYTLTNGTTADASQVMSNFNTIMNCANNNLAALAGATFTGNVGVVNPTRAVSSAQVILEGGYNGYGTGISFVSRTSSGGSNVEMARIVADGEGAWNTTTSTQDAGIRFFTTYQGSSAEKARIGSDGSWLVGTTTLGGWNGNFKAEVRSSGHAISAYSTGSGNALLLRVDGGSPGTLAGMFYGTTAVGSITSSGSSTAYNTTSDARMKDISVTQKSYRNVIEKLWIGDFRWKKDGRPGFGIVAQQAYPLFSEAVSKPLNSDGMWQADYGKLAPLALWGVKDIYGLVSEQQKQIVALDMQVHALSQQIAGLQDSRKQLVALKAANDNYARMVERFNARLSKLERQSKLKMAAR